jgi:hypothetical protein
MALLTREDAKQYLRIEHTAEDLLIDALIVRAKAELETWLDVPLTAREQTATDWASSDGPNPVRVLIFPRRPIGATITVVDGEGTTVASTTYRVDQVGGMVKAKDGYTFTEAPYTLTTECGLSLLEDWNDRVEPVVNLCLMDLVADLYQKRTPTATGTNGGGTSISWDVSRETSDRVRATMQALRLPVAV